MTSGTKRPLRYLAAIGISLIVGFVAMIGSAVVLTITGIYTSGHNINTPDFSIDWGPIQMETAGTIMMIVTFSLMTITFGLVIRTTRPAKK